MREEKNTLAGSAAMLVMALLRERDMYGYQMIEELRRRSDHTFDLKAGTLYPLLHALEEKGWISSYQEDADTARPRKYYHLTKSGRSQLEEKQAQWRSYSRAVNKVLEGGLNFG